ncbi:MAG: AAA family ATPase [Treponema sp.]|nr:AAA family ATPase [Treponema sp.]
MSNEGQKITRQMHEYEDTKYNELNYIGSLLVNISKGEKPDRWLAADDFLINNNGRIYNEIFKQLDEGITPDITTLYDNFKILPDNEKIDASYFGDISCISDSNIKMYERKIYEFSKNRNFIKAIRIAYEQWQGQGETDAIIKNMIPALSDVVSIRNEMTIKTAAEILTIEFPPVKWIVPDLIGEGLTMINGSPKIGKSWLSLNLSIAAASGGAFLGALCANQTGTLYLALEDTDRRIQSRLKKLQANKTNNLKISTQWRDGYIGLENYLRANTGIGLVIIDTLARFTNIEDFNAYAETTRALARLKKIADDLRVSIVVIHHAKKGTSKDNDKSDWMDAALGSTGLTGATDSTIYIKRMSRKDTAAQLFATGRDTADIEYNLKMDNDCGWVIINKAAVQESVSTKSKPVDYSKPRG